MKKLRLLILFLVLFTSNVKALSCDKKYLVQTVNYVSINEDIGCTDDYEEAKTMMLEYPSTEKNVAVIYNNGKIINARYAIAKFDIKEEGRSGSELTKLYANKELTGTRYTYYHGDWGSDGAFIDYYPAKNSIKIKLSGATGWISMNEAIITPISTLYADTITAKRAIRVRTAPSLNATQISTIQTNSTWKYADKVEAEGYLWYKINFSGSYAYVAGKELKSGNVYATEESTYLIKTYYYVNGSGNLIHYYRQHKRLGQASLNMGTAPANFKQNVKYYSFDSNYFYTTLEAMLDDYRNESYEHAFNATKPYFNYYMYLPIHNESVYTAEDLDQIIKNKGYTKAPDPNTVYYTLEGGWTNAPRTGVSALYGAGVHFMRVQEELGVNALLMFGTAINESKTGTSALALFKNNLFGQGAKDSCPISCANSYASVYESILAHAKLTGISYATPNYQYFYGSFYGNKGSGFGVNYASDPYWGEKTAKNTYQNDKIYGGQDYNANTLGIKMTSEAIPLKKSPSDDAATIYLLKNNKYGHLVANMSYIVTEKVQDGAGNYWYKVYSDAPLDKNQNITSGNYNFDYSYGYIKAEYLYLANNTEAVINASSYSVSRGAEVDLLKNVTAIDPEDGDITTNLIISGEVDSNAVGEYEVTYEVTDSSRFTVKKKIIVTVLPSDAPTIVASDIEIKQYKAFDPLKYVKVYDTYGNLINNVEVITNTVNTSVVGKYEVVYKATYQDLSITKKINVTVIKDEVPVLNVKNRTIKLNETFNYLTGVEAHDKEDGDLTNKVTYVGTVNTSKVGEYEVTYSVTDSVNQTTSKKVTIKVEEIEYVKKDGEFYFNELSFKNSKLIISGYLAIKGTDNRETDDITYDLIVRNNVTEEDTIIPLERFLEGRPERHYSDSKYDYSATWFKGNISLDGLSQGEYTLYVRARKGNLETISLFRNLFNKNMAIKGVSNNKGFIFRNNNYLDSYPIELFVFENGLIVDVNKPNQINMINNYKTLELNGSKLTIKGTSYNIGVSYAKDKNVTRNIVFENKKTKMRFTFNIGSIVGTDIPINVSDGFTRERGWFNNTIDLKDVPVGDYIIYIATSVDNYKDFGELNDIFMKDLKGVVSTFNGKKITFTLNSASRFRVEMHVEAV